MSDKQWFRSRLLYLTILFAVIALIAQLGFDGYTGSSGVAFNEVVDRALTGTVCKLVESADGTMVTYYTTCTDGAEPAGQVRKSAGLSLAVYLQQERALRIQQAQAAGKAPAELKTPQLLTATVSTSTALSDGDRDRGDEPARRARSGAGATWPLRPAGGAGCAGYRWPARYLESPCQGQAACRGHQSGGYREGDAGRLRRGSGQHRQRGGDPGGAAWQAAHRHARAGRRDRAPDARRTGAALAGDDARGEALDGLS